MKLLACRRGWSPTGGAERFLQRFAKGLADAGIGTTLIADERWPEDEWTAGSIERVPSMDPEGFARDVMAVKARHPDARLFSMERLPGADVFRAGDGLHSAWLDRLAAEDGRLGNWFRRRRKMHRQLLDLEGRLFSDPALRVVANSRMVARELMERHRFPENRIAVVPNGYDPETVDSEEMMEKRHALRSRLGIPESAVLFLFVGSGWKRKGAQVLVDAFRRLDHPDAWLALVGKGRAKRTKHPRIHLAGPVRPPLDWYLAADVFVLPTLYDPFSNACLEAAAYGLPVLTTDANGFAEVLEEYPTAGEVVPAPRAPDAWSAAMKRWMDPDRRHASKTALEKIRRHFTVQRNVTATVDFIRTSFP